VKLSTRSRYALRVLVELVPRYGMGLVPLAEITRAQELSQEYVESILRPLAGAGIVELKRGAGGGCRLARDPASLTPWDVVQVVEKFQAAPCERHSRGAPRCPRYEGCATRGFWAGLDRVVREYLAGVTLAELARRAPQPARRPGHEYEFHI
jgi:Rrf2 family iron-sulfur cluster assembly transcriptional regulator